MSTVHQQRIHTPAFRLLGILIVLSLILAVLIPSVSAAETAKDLSIEMTIGQTDYTVNGNAQTMDTAPSINKDGYTMVPLRFVAEAIGAQVTWAAADRTATLAYQDNTVVFTVGSDEMKINGEAKSISTPAVIQNDRTMIPLRAAAEAIGAVVTFNDGKVTFTKADTLKVSNFDQLQQAVVSSASTIVLENFDTTGETTTKLVIQRPLVLDGNHAKVDFGFEILSNGVTVKDFIVNISEFDKAVSAPGKNENSPGDCIAVEIHNDNTGDPVIVTGMDITHDVFKNNNSAIYLADNSYVQITNNKIKVENKENNPYERGGIFIGANVSGLISGNDIDSARTGMPMSPIGLACTLDKLTADVKVAPVVIKDNTIKCIYVTKMYASGQLFGEDGLVLKAEDDFGVRAALSDFIVALAQNNTYTHHDGYPVENEASFVQCRLDKIMAGAPYYEKNVFFNVTDGKMVSVPAPAEEA